MRSSAPERFDFAQHKLRDWCGVWEGFGDFFGKSKRSQGEPYMPCCAMSYESPGEWETTYKTAHKTGLKGSALSSFSAKILSMKIVLVVTDSKGKNLVFSTDTLKSYSIDESIKLVKQGKLESVHMVKTGQGSYLRANPNEEEDDNLDTLSISSHKLFLSINDVRYLISEDGSEAYTKYLFLHGRSIEERGEHVIHIDGFPLITKEQVTEKLKLHTRTVLAAAKEFSIDPNILGAILIDEIARVSPWEDTMDKLLAAHIGVNASVGIAQMKINTVRELIAKGYYNPNPDDRKISTVNIAKAPKAYLYAYAKQPRHSIRFGAARIRQIIDHWAHEVDLSNRPEIIGTLYSWKLGTLRPNPGSSPRGLQIAREFYPLSKKILQR